MAIREMKGQGWRRPANINLNPGHLFVQQPPKTGKGSRDSCKLLRQRLQQGETTITPQDKLNQIRQKACILN